MKLAVGRLSLVIALTLGLQACGGSGGGDSGSSGIEYSADLSAVFDPTTSQIPTTNDVLFSGSTDGTLNIPLSGSTPPTAKDGLTTMLNTLDGFSLTMPITTSFAVAPQASSVVLGSTVRLFEVTKSAAGTVTGVTKELGATDVAVVASGINLAIVPLKPLKESTSYMVVLTNGIKDSIGKAASKSFYYALTQSETELTGSYVGLEPLRKLTVAQETAAAGAGVSKDSIILSWSFTTQSTTPVLKAAKAQATARTLVTQFSGRTTTNLEATLPGIANVHVGQLTVPYYLSATKPLDAFWLGANSQPVTRYNASPKATAELPIPVLMTVPNALSGKVMPAEGWPVVIYQHGITSDRLSMVAIADTLASQGFAAIAIDLPLHGIEDTANPLKTNFERTFDLDLVNNDTGAAGADGKPDSSGAYFINLSNQLVSRDNIRQAISDIMVLRNSLGGLQNANGVKLDASKVSYVGISLGSIVGTGYLSIEDRPTTALLSVPGGGIARLLDGSATFGPEIEKGLKAKGLIKGTADYDSFMYVTQFLIDAADPINLGAAVPAKHQILMHEVVGTNSSNADQVVPNTVAGAPLSGTEPLIRIMGLTSVSTNTQGVDGVVRFTAGEHASLLTPRTSAAVTMEMQSEMAGFLLTNGQRIPVTNTSVVK